LFISILAASSISVVNDPETADSKFFWTISLKDNSGSLRM